MLTTILDKLGRIPAESGVRLLYACESGSRGWEFPSPDSDYDVRFIYLRPASYYLSVMEREDELRFPISGELDLYGWDIRKVLQLMRRSNATPFEWLQSPIVYAEEPGFRDSLWALSQQYFSKRANTHHYMGIARKAMATMTGGSIAVKKLFYVLRPLLAAKWCLTRESIAPMRIGPLMELLPAALRTEVGRLILLKAAAAEAQPTEIAPALRRWIDETFAFCESAGSGLPGGFSGPGPVDAYFLQLLRRYDDPGFTG